MDSLLLYELQDLYSAEKQIVAALPEMQEAATSPQLKKHFEKHRAETERHIERLENVFESLQAKPGRHKCKGMEGLLEEGHEVIREEAEPRVKDAALIATAQRVEHYEMAGYGTVRTFAQILGLDGAVSHLQDTLDEEKKTDARLTDLAVSEINPAAV
ncbi:MAG: ferritin-like domain-containing protein [Planctomycetota bacterium]